MELKKEKNWKLILFTQVRTADLFVQLRVSWTTWTQFEQKSYHWCYATENTSCKQGAAKTWTQHRHFLFFSFLEFYFLGLFLAFSVVLCAFMFCLPLFVDLFLLLILFLFTHCSLFWELFSVWNSWRWFIEGNLTFCISVAKYSLCWFLEIYRSHLKGFNTTKSFLSHIFHSLCFE